MVINFKTGYKIIFIVGLLLGFASLFLDWYYLQAVSVSGETVVYWVYNVLFDWSTRFSEGAMFNDSYKPKNASLPVAIVFVYVVSMFLSAYSALFNDVEREDSLAKVKKFNFVTLSFVTLIGFFVMVYPMFFLLPNRLYYPLLMYRDYDLGMVFYYSVGLGYVFQAISFALTFPYAFFTYSVINNFERENNSAENVINQYIESARDHLDLDKLIAREEYKIESENDTKLKVPKSKMEKIYEEYLSTRGRK